MHNDQGRMINSGWGRTPLVLLFSFTIAHCSLFLSSAFAQVSGSVESVGFQNNYRPDCWTPMVVVLKAETEKSADYLIRVRQEDMDRDRPVYTRTVTVTGT